MAEHDYSADWPANISVAEEVQTFFKDFYRLSDAPGIDEKYVEAFAPDATFVLASKKSTGRDEILETRKGMWKAVSARKHTVKQIYPFGDNSLEFMLHGHVEYELKSGGSARKEWAGHARLVKGDGGKLVFEFYQVYLDTA